MKIIREKRLGKCKCWSEFGGMRTKFDSIIPPGRLVVKEYN